MAIAPVSKTGEVKLLGVRVPHFPPMFKKGNKYRFKKGNKVCVGRKVSKETILKRIETRRNSGKPWHSKSTKIKFGKSKKGNQYTLGKHWKVSEKGRLNIIKANIKKWKNPEFRERTIKSIFKACNVKPNKVEISLDKFLNKILPKEYKFVGDGQFILGGKCPDFLNINGKKKLIELYGNYWHENDNPQDRIDYFKQYGFNTLVIWESELQNLLKLKRRILKFN